MRTPFTLTLLAGSLLATAQIDINKMIQQHGGGGVKVEEDNEPFVPNSFIGSFRMENHRFKNTGSEPGAGFTEDKDSPMNVLYWSSEDMTMMQTVATDQKEGQDVKMLTDLKNKWQYMLMTDENGEKTAMKSKKQKITMDEDTTKKEPEVTKTSETKTIDGHTCTKTIVKTEDGTWTGWVAEDVKAPFEDMARNVKKGNESMTRGMGEMPGFPLEFEWVSADGKDKTVTYIRDLQYGTVDASAFSLDGYEVVEMPSYGQFSMTLIMNHFAILTCAVSIFLLGGLWYSKALFVNAWNRENGGPAKMEGRSQGHPSTVYISSFLFAWIAAYVFAWWLGPAPDLHYAVKFGLVCGVGVAATSFGINYRFASRSWDVWAIDGGYHIVQFLLYGVILGLWH